MRAVDETPMLQEARRAQRRDQRRDGIPINVGHGDPTLQRMNYSDSYPNSSGIKLPVTVILVFADDFLDAHEAGEVPAFHL